MKCESLKFSRHAFERMFLRGIAPDAVARVVADGEIIAEYPDDQPFPSSLVLGFDAGLAVHIVVARDENNGECHIITVYRPDPALWDETFRFRIKP